MRFIRAVEPRCTFLTCSPCRVQLRVSKLGHCVHLPSTSWPVFVLILRVLSHLVCEPIAWRWIWERNVLEHLRVVWIHHELVPFLRSSLRWLKVERRHNSSKGLLALRELSTIGLQRLVLSDSNSLPFQTALSIVSKVIIVRLRTFSVNSFVVIFLLDINLMIKSDLVVTFLLINVVFITFGDSLKISRIIVIDEIISFVLLFILFDLVFDSRWNMLELLLWGFLDWLHDLSLPMSRRPVDSPVLVVVKILFLGSWPWVHLRFGVITLERLYVTKRISHFSLGIFLLPHFCELLKRGSRAAFRRLSWSCWGVSDPIANASPRLTLWRWNTDRNSSIWMLINGASGLSLRVISIKPFISEVLIVTAWILTPKVISASSPYILFSIHLSLFLGLQINEDPIFILDILEFPRQHNIFSFFGMLFPSL